VNAVFQVYNKLKIVWGQVCYRLTETIYRNVERDVANNIKTISVSKVQHKNKENSFKIIHYRYWGILINQYQTFKLIQTYVILICFIGHNL